MDMTQISEFYAFTATALGAIVGMLSGFNLIKVITAWT